MNFRYIFLERQKKAKADLIIFEKTRENPLY